MTWRDDAACKGSWDLFYLEVGAPVAQVKEARQICAGCPVKTECRDEALSRPEQHDIWAGTTPTERRKLRQPARQANILKSRARAVERRAAGRAS